MYQIYYNDSLVYDPRSANSTDPGDVSFSVLDATLQLAIGSGGQLTFTLPAGHPMIGKIEMKAGGVKVVEVLPGGSSTVFLGRVIRDEIDFDNDHTYECEGRLAYLNDTLVRPGEIQFDSFEQWQAFVAAGENNAAPAFRLQMLLDAHNAMAGPGGAIQLGNVTVGGSAFDRTAADYLTTWERMLMELPDSELGGFFSMRYEGDAAYLDYIASTADLTDYNEQAITFGENLAEITRKRTGGDTFNAILPFDSYGLPLLGWPGNTLPDGYYGENNEYYKTGHILKLVDVPSTIVRTADIATPETYSAQEAIDMSIAYLENNAEVNVSELSVKAYDRSAADPSIEPFRAGKRVKILDPPHGIREAYLVMGITIDLTGGADVGLDLGAKATSLTASGAQRINEEAAKAREMRLLFRNESPGTAQAAGTLANIPDISGCNLFYIEVCWSTGYTAYRAGTWVYVPDSTAVTAMASVDWYSGGAVSHAYRAVTIDKSAAAGSQISISTGAQANSGNVTNSTSSAVVTTIIGY